MIFSFFLNSQSLIFLQGTEDIYEALWPACAKYRGGDAAQLATVLGDGGNVHKYLVCVRACVCVRVFVKIFLYMYIHVCVFV